MNQFVKLFMFPLAIVASIGAGSIFAEQKYHFPLTYNSNFLLYESKYTLDL